MNTVRDFLGWCVVFVHVGVSLRNTVTDDGDDVVAVLLILFEEPKNQILNLSKFIFVMICAILYSIF